MTRTLATMAGVLAVVLVLTACAGGSGTVPLSDNLTVVAHDIRFSESTYRAEHGTVAITYPNEGSIPHTLVIEGIDDFKLDVQSNGDVDHGSVDLGRGKYVIYCDVAGHRDAGMEASLEVD